MSFALIHTMKASTIPIKTVGLGLIARCGFLIFIAGKKGPKNTYSQHINIVHPIQLGQCWKRA